MSSWSSLLLPLMLVAGLHCEECGLRTRTGPTDHWPTVESAEGCKYFHCSREMAACLLDPGCIKSLTCTETCTGDLYVAGLCAFQCGEAGMRSDRYLAMMTCWGSHRCQEDRPEPAGPCAANSLGEGRREISSLDLVSGEWWVVMAWNCHSGITFASCHHWLLNQTHNTVAITLQGPDGPVRKQVQQLASLPYPGVLRGTYDHTNGAFPNLPQLEDYHIIDRDDSHLLIIFCHGMPDINLNGALVLSRSPDMKMSEETLTRFKAAIREHGYNPDETCHFDNTDCPSGWLNGVGETENS